VVKIIDNKNSMKHTYKIEGMTCNNCKASVEKYLNDLQHISHVSIDLEKGEAKVTMDQHLTADVLQKALPDNIPCQKKTVGK
jgi:copper chaperone CopZ